LDSARLQAVAAAAAPSAVESALPHIAANLEAVERSGVLDADLLQRLDAVIAASGSWIFDGSGRVDAAPALRDVELLKLSFSQETLAAVRRLACAHVPPDRHSFALVEELRDRQFRSSKASKRPHVVITIGPPGAGKTYILHNCAVDFLRNKYALPPKEDFVNLDPDYYISNVLDNNNDWREMANFLNHESLMCAIGQQRHVLFDHTGKDLLNTCGRVISRFKEANYVVHLVIVLSDYSMCRSRTQDRLGDTGRPVADSYTRAVFEALQTNIPWYLENNKSVADTTTLYPNNFRSSPTARVIETDSDVRSAVEFAQARLKLQTSSKMPPSAPSGR